MAPNSRVASLCSQWWCEDVLHLGCLKFETLVHTGCHHPPTGLAFGEPDDRLQRMIQYAAASWFYQ
jgi:hypothetical protein